MRTLTTKNGFAAFEDDGSVANGITCSSTRPTSKGGPHGIASAADPDAEVAAPNTAVAVALDWRRLDAFVAKSKHDPRVQVLHGSWGTAEPGRLLALMGPSGSGKTTLLNILANRPTLGDFGSFSGARLYNGWPSLPRRVVGYVMQKDLFFSSLTVDEHLRCTAALRLPISWSAAQRTAEFERVVHTLRLGPVLTSRVGSNTERGISGGELKRLNIATELLAQPQLLFLDEPLSGLDSSLATLVLHALSTDAATRSTTILLSVHHHPTLCTPTLRLHVVPLCRSDADGARGAHGLLWQCTGRTGARRVRNGSGAPAARLRRRMADGHRLWPPTRRTDRRSPCVLCSMPRPATPATWQSHTRTGTSTHTRRNARSAAAWLCGSVACRAQAV